MSVPVAPDQECVEGAKLFADRNLLVSGLGLKPGGVIAEVGVAFGDFSEQLIHRLSPSRFVGIDLFELHHVPVIWGRPSVDLFGGKTHLSYYRERLRSFKSAGVEVVQSDSSLALSGFPSRTFDLIYIDGAHDEEGVRKDADAASRAIKADGFLVFNDYIIHDHIANDPYGIVQVVNEMCISGEWKIVAFAFQPNMFCDIALRRRAFSR